MKVTLNNIVDELKQVNHKVAQVEETYLKTPNPWSLAAF